MTEDKPCSLPVALASIAFLEGVQATAPLESAYDGGARFSGFSNPALLATKRGRRTPAASRESMEKFFIETSKAICSQTLQRDLRWTKVDGLTGDAGMNLLHIFVLLYRDTDKVPIEAIKHLVDLAPLESLHLSEPQVPGRFPSSPLSLALGIPNSSAEEEEQQGGAAVEILIDVVTHMVRRLEEWAKNEGGGALPPVFLFQNPRLQAENLQRCCDQILHIFKCTFNSFVSLLLHCCIQEVPAGRFVPLVGSPHKQGGFRRLFFKSAVKFASGKGRGGAVCSLTSFVANTLVYDPVIKMRFVVYRQIVAFWPLLHRLVNLSDMSEIVGSEDEDDAEALVLHPWVQVTVLYKWYAYGRTFIMLEVVIGISEIAVFVLYGASLLGCAWPPRNAPEESEETFRDLNDAEGACAVGHTEKCDFGSLVCRWVGQGVNGWVNMRITLWVAMFCMLFLFCTREFFELTGFLDQPQGGRGIRMRANLRAYCRDVFNFFILTAVIAALFVLLMLDAASLFPDASGGEEGKLRARKRQDASMLVLFALVLLGMFVRLLENYRAFKQIGAYTAAVFLVFKDAGWFLFLLMTVQIAFSLLFAILLNTETEPEESVSVLLAFYKAYAFGLLGDFGDLLETMDTRWFIIVVLIVFHIILNVVMLNLLISVVSDSWAKSNDKKSLYITQERMQAIFNVESVYARHRLKDSDVFPQCIFVAEAEKNGTTEGLRALNIRLTQTTQGGGGDEGGPGGAARPDHREDKSKGEDAEDKQRARMDKLDSSMRACRSMLSSVDAKIAGFEERVLRGRSTFLVNSTDRTRNCGKGEECPFSHEPSHKPFQYRLFVHWWYDKLKYIQRSQGSDGSLDNKWWVPLLREEDATKDIEKAALEDFKVWETQTFQTLQKFPLDSGGNMAGLRGSQHDGASSSIDVATERNRGGYERMRRDPHVTRRPESPSGSRGRFSSPSSAAAAPSRRDALQRSQVASRGSPLPYGSLGMVPFEAWFSAEERNVSESTGGWGLPRTQGSPAPSSRFGSSSRREENSGHTEQGRPVYPHPPIVATLDQGQRVGSGEGASIDRGKRSRALGGCLHPPPQKRRFEEAVGSTEGGYGRAKSRTWSQPVTVTYEEKLPHGGTSRQIRERPLEEVPKFIESLVEQRRCQERPRCFHYYASGRCQGGQRCEMFHASWESVQDMRGFIRQHKTVLTQLMKEHPDEYRDRWWFKMLSVMHDRSGLRAAQREYAQSGRREHVFPDEEADWHEKDEYSQQDGEDRRDDRTSRSGRDWMDGCSLLSGEDGRDDRTSRAGWDGRDECPQRGGADESDDRTFRGGWDGRDEYPQRGGADGRDDRTFRGGWDGRDEYPQREGADGRDDRTSGRGWDGRDEYPQRGGADGRDDRTSGRGWDGRDEYPQRGGADERDDRTSGRGWDGRDEYPQRGGADGRDDRTSGRGWDGRDEGGADGRDDRTSGRGWDGRDEYPQRGGADGRDDRTSGRGWDGRDEYPQRGGADRRLDGRDDRTSGRGWDGRDEYPQRGGADGRDDRTSGRGWDGRDEYPQRGGADGRDDRTSRRGWDGRDEYPQRGGADGRDDRTSGRGWDGRDEYPQRGGADGRDDRTSGRGWDGRDEYPQRGGADGRDDRTSGRGWDGRDEYPQRGGADGRLDGRDDLSCSRALPLA
uniref:Ion transport domain-containing protein n=1 Tax=Chromera velia CCMP2878 TaxID=1169474 RepID=A0A0G4F665_9ALVE|eukprot:Cvel_15335.t1-p1 / transcript=Cvel_15335.t1 / gene=Cvel_15335 / organism=Chromera_velia_CCMP2878 / gene_product=Formin-2, putative / transcript_product=Formin-2, putative / location=Cvel_scaffold1128:6224-17979(-) / protein_length=1658 / sequence_SO=supercontig / SO=protein_coding / is_pseudo=false